jgi:hypothetical protein
MADRVKIELRSIRKALNDRIKAAEQGIKTGQRAVKRARTAKDHVTAKKNQKTLADAKGSVRRLKMVLRTLEAECCDQVMNCNFDFI